MFRELHEDIWGNYFGGKALAQKTLQLGYYWPTMSKDSISLVRKCDRCQKIANVLKLPPREVIKPLWPMALRIVGDRLDWAYASGQKSSEVRGHNSWLLYLMGISGAFIHHYWGQDYELCLEKYSVILEYHIPSSLTTGDNLTIPNFGPLATT